MAMPQRDDTIEAIKRPGGLTADGGGATSILNGFAGMRTHAAGRATSAASRPKVEDDADMTSR